MPNCQMVVLFFIVWGSGAPIATIAYFLLLLSLLQYCKSTYFLLFITGKAISLLLLMFPYHLVSSSPWPLLMSLSAFIFAIGFLSSNLLLFLLAFFCIALILVAWFRDLIPSLLAGSHPRVVQLALIYGFILFLLSEIFLFFSFFWAYFHSAFIPSIELGLWPPIGVESLDPWSIPLMGTLILLSSGATATLAHYGSISGDKALVLFGLFLTILLAIAFLALQNIPPSTTCLAGTLGAYLLFAI